MSVTGRGRFNFISTPPHSRPSLAAVKVASAMHDERKDVMSILTGVSVTKAEGLFASADSDEDGIISAMDFRELLKSVLYVESDFADVLDIHRDRELSRQEFVSALAEVCMRETLDVRSLARSHERARVALVQELACLQLELQECDEEQDATARVMRDGNIKAMKRIWDIMRQCQIKEQVRSSDVEARHTAFELTTSAKSMFDAIDADGNGSLSVQEVRRALAGFGQTMVQQAVARMLRVAGSLPDESMEIEISMSQFEEGIVPLLQQFLLQNEIHGLKKRRKRQRLAAREAAARESSLCLDAQHTLRQRREVKTAAASQQETDESERKRVAAAASMQLISSWRPPMPVGLTDSEQREELARRREMEWEERSLQRLVPLHGLAPAQQVAAQGGAEHVERVRREDAQRFLQRSIELSRGNFKSQALYWLVRGMQRVAVGIDMADGEELAVDRTSIRNKQRAVAMAEIVTGGEGRERWKKVAEERDGHGGHDWWGRRDVQDGGKDGGRDERAEGARGAGAGSSSPMGRCTS